MFKIVIFMFSAIYHSEKNPGMTLLGRGMGTPGPSSLEVVPGSGVGSHCGIRSVEGSENVHSNVVSIVPILSENINIYQFTKMLVPIRSSSVLLRNARPRGTVGQSQPRPGSFLPCSTLTPHQKQLFFPSGLH